MKITLKKTTNAKGYARLFLKHIYEKLGETKRAMPPLECKALAAQIGLNDSQMAAALRDLRTTDILRFAHRRNPLC
jgi:hypothetical protein